MRAMASRSAFVRLGWVAQRVVSFALAELVRVSAKLLQAGRADGLLMGAPGCSRRHCITFDDEKGSDRPPSCRRQRY